MSESLEDAVRRLVAEVEDVTWNGYAWIGLEPCVACGNEKPKHRDNCPLDAALRDLLRLV